MNPSSAAQTYFPGGGEMGQRIRTFNWAGTWLGPIQEWPQSLRAAVSICIGSRYPIVIWWGREKLTQLYNDGYIPMMGEGKHPLFLGQSARDCWKEIWHIIDPMLVNVFKAGEATWSEDFLLVLERSLPREECYFTFSYSPIRDDSGAVGGIFCAVTETTERVIGERRLKTLRDLGRTVMEAKAAPQACSMTALCLAENRADIPFAIFYLMEEDGRHAQLAATTGIEPSSPAAPARIDLNEAAKWPLKQVFDTGVGEEVFDISARFGPMPGGPWPESSETALVLPIAAAGQSKPTGFFVSGTSPRRILDANYRGFFDLIAGHVATGISNARAYEAERKRAEALAEIDRAKTAFFSNVSHELRTPLTLMLGPIEEELHECREPRPLLELAHRNSLRLLKLVNTLLDFSRIEARRAKPVFEPTDLAAYTADLASGFRSAIEKAELKFTVDCPPLAELVYVDREMWEKIVLNLLSNAFKFTFEGEVKVELRGGGEWAELSVSDTGTGIPTEELPHVFERFHRVHGARSRTHEGTGIGLALVQELSRLLGGNVEVTSTLGQGSVFTVRLPIGTKHLLQDKSGAGRTLQSTATGKESFVKEAMRWLPEDDKELATVASGGQAADLAVATGFGRIVLAEDNADMRDYISRLLVPHYEVIAVADGQAALETVRAQRPDLVLSDVMMPRLDGFGLLRELRADKETSTIPIILISARAGEEAKIEGMAQHADDYIIKPFNARELLARVGTHLGLAKMRRDAERAVRESEERYRGLFNSMDEGFCAVEMIFDEEQKPVDFLFLEANPAFERQMGFSQAKGRRMRELAPTRDQNWFDIFGKVAMTGESVRFESRSDSLERCYEVCAFPMDAPEQRRVAVIYNDITDRKSVQGGLERLVAERTAKWREIAEELEAFSYSIAHDMRAPLRTVQSFSQVLVEDHAENLDEDARSHLKRISSATRRMDQLILDALNYGRVSRSEIPIKSVDAAKLLRELVESYPALHSEGVEIEIAGDFSLVQANEAALTQCFSNLLGNAVKFVAPGMKAKVRVWSETQNDRVKIFFKDNGIGIEKKDQARIFQIFERVDSAYEGTGIGLAIVKRAVSRMGGEVGVESEIGKGSMFWVELPKG